MTQDFITRTATFTKADAQNLDLRVDDHPDAAQELARLFDLHDLYFGSPGTVLLLEGPLAQEVRQHLLLLGRSQPDLHEALDTVAVPLNQLGERELCPGKAALEKFNQSLR